MIKELLKLVFVEKSSLNEVAKKLSTTFEDVRGRLKMLVHLGYIKTTKIERSACDGSCLGCFISSGCSIRNEMPGNPIQGYELTEKGRRVVES